ncbi:MAG: DUF302 domain-containing protein [Bacteroidales bacterium]|nr:DUF302 domain-containing protein [Bacteroidales bacterium]MCF8328335.1 DUF302 domain-containing protein [Bacteroidales bacterium]
MKYYIEKVKQAGFDETIEELKDKLPEAGFGVLTEIDFQEKFKEKFDVNFRRYNVLGACNPSLGYKAIQAEDKIATMLPCNIVVQETEDGNTSVAAVDPVASMQAVDNEEVINIAKEIKRLLEGVINDL